MVGWCRWFFPVQESVTPLHRCLNLLGMRPNRWPMLSEFDMKNQPYLPFLLTVRSPSPAMVASTLCYLLLIGASSASVTHTVLFRYRVVRLPCSHSLSIPFGWNWALKFHLSTFVFSQVPLLFNFLWKFSCCFVCGNAMQIYFYPSMEILSACILELLITSPKSFFPTISLHIRFSELIPYLVFFFPLNFVCYVLFWNVFVFILDWCMGSQFLLLSEKDHFIAPLSSY